MFSRESLASTAVTLPLPSLWGGVRRGGGEEEEKGVRGGREEEEEEVRGDGVMG